MLKFILRRIVILVPILLGVSFLVFSILAMMPADVARIHLGMDSTLEAVEQWNEEHGINDPFLLRYFDYMKGLFFGDFGKSWATNTPVTLELSQRVPTTLTLGIGTVFIISIVGIPIGVISAVKQYSVFDYVTVLMALLVTSMPAFWLALILVLVFSLELGWLPSTGGGSLKHFILPWITLSSAMSCQLIRMSRSSMLEVIRSDYVQTARSKGAKPARVVLVHELRNALLPMITIIGIIFGVTLGSAIVTETVFALPGVGTYLLSGILRYDMPVVMICVMFIATAIGVINLVVDVLYMVVDPRLRSQFVKNYVGR